MSGTVVHKFEACRTSTPERLAVASLCGKTGAEPSNLTYGELGTLVDRVVFGLQARGVGPGSMVATFVDEGAAVAVAELAILKAGAVVVPLDVTYPAERLDLLLNDCNANAVLLLDKDATLLLPKLTSEATVATYEELVCCRTPETDVTACHAKTGAVIPQELAEVENYADPDGLSHVVFTSGSTGPPKGVVCTHLGLLSYAEAKNAFHGIDSTSRVLLASAITWDPQLGDIFPTLGCGATLCTVPRAMIIQDIGGSLRKTRATHVFATPALWALLDASPSDLPDLAVVALGGERIPVKMMETWSQTKRLINTYGVTEATICQTAVDVVNSQHAPGMVGKPLPGVLATVGPGGELLLAGPQLARGYLNRPDLDRERFVSAEASGLPPEVAAAAPVWLKTGDYARIDDGGSIEIFGRLDDQVKIRGFRVEPGSIESVVVGSGLVKSCAVQLVESPPRLVAYVTTTVSQKGFDNGGEAAIRLLCERQLPRHEVPAQIFMLESMPLTATGKISRRDLPSPPPLRTRSVAADGSGEEHNFAAAGDSKEIAGADEKRLRTPTECIVARVWEEVLGVEKIGPYDHFFELGGSSITSTQMIRKLSAELAKDNTTKSSAYELDFEHIKVRLCGLHRKPRLREYAALVDWSALAAPNRSVGDTEAFANSLNVPQATPPSGDKDILARLAAEMPEDRDRAAWAATALTAAVRHGQHEVVQALLEANAPADGLVNRNNRAHSPLMCAAVHSHRSCAVALIGHGAAVNITTRANASAGHLAAMHSEEVLGVLLTAGLAVRARDLNKWTSLHYAAWGGLCGSIKMLLEAGSAIDAKDKWERTPLMWACFRGHLGAVKLLLDAGAAFHPRYERGRSRPQARHLRRHDNMGWGGCLHLGFESAIATADEQCRILAVLLARGVPVGDRDGHDATVLHAVSRGTEAAASTKGLRQSAVLAVCCAAAKLLLNAGADVNARDARNRTPLHEATATRSLAIAKILLAAGADATATDREGRTAADLADCVGEENGENENKNDDVGHKDESVQNFAPAGEVTALRTSTVASKAERISQVLWSHGDRGPGEAIVTTVAAAHEVLVKLCREAASAQERAKKAKKLADCPTIPGGGFLCEGAKPRDWVCPNEGCGVVVFGRKKACFKCGARRPDVRDKGEEKQDRVVK